MCCVHSVHVAAMCAAVALCVCVVCTVFVLLQCALLWHSMHHKCKHAQLRGAAPNKIDSVFMRMLCGSLFVSH